MQPRISDFAALTSLVFLAASDLVVSQITAPDCSPSWEWSFNSLGQNACTVAAFLLGTCNGGTFEIDPLQQPGYHYPGPTGNYYEDLCKCNTVAYNLISACDGCQNGTWIGWSEYSFNCTKVLSPSTFPNPVPAETRVQQWALADITNVNFWNVTAAQIVGDLPEILAGDTIAPSNSTSTSKKSSNTGAIAGGVAGGVVALAIIGGLVFYIQRQRRRSQAPSVVDSGVPGARSMSHMSHIVSSQSDDGTKEAYMPGSPGTPTKPYDPNDPATYPRRDSVQTTTPDFRVNVPAVPYYGSPPGNTFTSTQTGGLGGNTLPNMQIPQGYHGLPTV